jgi:hypothetical protein
MRRAGVLGAAIAFARSPQGQHLIGEARRRFDTPENRAKVRQLVAERRRAGSGSTPPTVVRATDGRVQGGR